MKNLLEKSAKELDLSQRNGKELALPNRTLNFSSSADSASRTMGRLDQPVKDTYSHRQTIHTHSQTHTCTYSRSSACFCLCAESCRTCVLLNKERKSRRVLSCGGGADPSAWCQGRSQGRPPVPTHSEEKPTCAQAAHISCCYITNYSLNCTCELIR